MATEPRETYHEGFKLSGFHYFGKWFVAAFLGKVMHNVEGAPTWEEACEKQRAWIDNDTNGQRAIDTGGQ